MAEALARRPSDYRDHSGHRGTRAIQRMVEYAPSTGGLALWVRHQDLPDDPSGSAEARANTALVATDGNTLFYHLAFEALPLADQAGLVAHEVLHIALRHPQRFLDLQQRLGDVDLQLFNLCADAIVNSTLSHLSWLRLPATAVFLERLLADALGTKQGVETALLDWDVERLYRAIDDRLPREQEGRRQAPNQPRSPQRIGARADGPKAAAVRALGAQSPADLIIGPDTPAAPQAEADQAREWSERLLRAHTGDGEHSMLRSLIADLPRTRTPWEQALRSQLAHSLAPQREVSWSRPTRSYLANQGRCGPHRRMPFEPGFSPTKAVPRLVVVVDVSGSIENDLMGRFAREIEAITRRLEAGLVLVIGDDRVQRVAHFEPGRSDLRAIEFKGGGGTDFTPLLEEADKHRPDIAVVLTDLQGPARWRPRWPVIWAVPETQALAIQPFGRKLILS